VAHPELETAEAAQAGLAGLPEDRQKLYWDVILSRLPELVRRILEARMLDLKNYEYQSDFARKYYGQGRTEGRAEGREEGLRRAVIELVCARLPELRGELEGRLGGRTEEQLVQLITELGTAQGEDGIRAVLDRQV